MQDIIRVLSLLFLLYMSSNIFEQRQQSNRREWNKLHGTKVRCICGDNLYCMHASIYMYSSVFRVVRPIAHDYLRG